MTLDDFYQRIKSSKEVLEDGYTLVEDIYVIIPRYILMAKKGQRLIPTQLRGLERAIENERIFIDSQKRPKKE